VNDEIRSPFDLTSNERNLGHTRRDDNENAQHSFCDKPLWRKIAGNMRTLKQVS
jgi:hypothetical protein